MDQYHLVGLIFIATVYTVFIVKLTMFLVDVHEDKKCFRVLFILDRLEDIVARLEKLITPDHEADKGILFIVEDGVKKEMKAMLLREDQLHDRECSVAFAADDGVAAPVDGAPKWSTTNEAVAFMEVDPADGFKAKLKFTNVEGSFKVRCLGDADRGPGVEDVLAESETIDVLFRKASQGFITIGN